jgi:hypothetical protein
MPTVLRIGPYRFFFYASDGDEPPHIHVERDDKEAKFWLDPVAYDSSAGFRKRELARVERLASENRGTLA